MKLTDYRKIAPQVNAALTAAIEAHGFKLTKLRATICEQDGTVSIRITAADTNFKDANGNATTADAERYKVLCSVYDLKPEWLGQTFPLGHVDYVLIGLLNRRSDKVVSIKRVADGKNYIATPTQVRHAFIVKAATTPKPTLAVINGRTS